MPAYGITFTEPASPRLTQLLGAISRKDYQAPVGVAAVKILKEHFAVRNAGSHPSAASVGAAPSELYLKFADATNYVPSSSGIVASINHPAVRQRLLGGTIRPVNVKNLTIAANAFAYGKRAATVGVALKFMFAYDEFRSCWRPALVAPDALMKDTGAPRKDGSRRQRTVRPSGIYFWLVKSVSQGPDPDVLPDRDKLLSGVTAALDGWVRYMLGKN